MKYFTGLRTTKENAKDQDVSVSVILLPILTFLNIFVLISLMNKYRQLDILKNPFEDMELNQKALV